uniref:Gastrokine-1 n=1 Tax=Terrapene triunguis TaxID=2587831 RepID=A0A674IDV8_9SAUR
SVTQLEVMGLLLEWKGNENNQGNDGGNSHQTVSINNDKHVANIDSNNGLNSWNSIWDYGNGYIATRILSKKACIIAKMNKNVMPDVVELPQLIKEKKKAGSQGPPPVELQFAVSKTRVSDLAPYGKSVESMCRGIPTYVAREAHGNPKFRSHHAWILWGSKYRKEFCSSGSHLKF